MIDDSEEDGTQRILREIRAEIERLKKMTTFISWVLIIEIIIFILIGFNLFF